MSLLIFGQQEGGVAGAHAAAEAASASGSTGGLVLKALVFGGALLYVFSKSAKFSLFKPAEEMVSKCMPLELNSYGVGSQLTFHNVQNHGTQAIIRAIYKEKSLDRHRSFSSQRCRLIFG